MPSNQYNSSYTGTNHDTYVTKSQLVDLIYPVGSIYISLNNTNPTALFGGSWEAVQDRFLLGAGNNYNGNATGGATSTTSGGPSNNTSGGPSNNTSGSTAITVAQMPSHNHGSAGNHSHQMGIRHVDGTSTSGEVLNTNIVAGVSDGRIRHSTTTNGAHTHTSQGSGQGHTHTLSSHTHSLQSHTHTTTTMPPYLAVYMWKRVA